MVRGLVEAFDSVLGSDVVGRKYPLEDCSTDGAGQFLRRSSQRESAIRSAGGSIGASFGAAAGRQYDSGDFGSSLGMRIIRYQLFVVDSLAAYSGCRPRWDAGSSGITHQ
jgi:hypothetical protein